MKIVGRDQSSSIDCVNKHEKNHPKKRKNSFIMPKNSNNSSILILNKDNFQIRGESVSPCDYFANPKKNSNIEPECLSKIDFSLDLEEIQMCRERYSDFTLVKLFLRDIKKYVDRVSNYLQSAYYPLNFKNALITENKEDKFFIFALFKGSPWNHSNFGKTVMLMPMIYGNLFQSARKLEACSDIIIRCGDQWMIRFDIIVQRTPNIRTQNKNYYQMLLILPKERMVVTFLKESFVIFHGNQELFAIYNPRVNYLLEFIVSKSPSTVLLCS